MNSLFNDSAIETIKRIKKIFLWTAVSILIGEVVVCAILILAQNFNETIGRLMGSFAVCALMMFFGVNNFSRMEKGDRIVQSFALVSLIGNIIWLLLSFLFIWNVVPYMESLNKYPYYSMSIVARIFVVAIDIAVMCFLISNIWSIKETVKPVRPLKITAIICALYCGIYSVVVTVGDVRSVMDQRWYALAGLAGFAFVIMGIAASTISNSGTKKGQGEVGAGVANIDKKEVQAKMLADPAFTQVILSRDDYTPEYQVDFDREKLALYGLNLSTAATYIRNRINGSTASYFREDGDEYDIKVMYDPEHRQSLEDIENITLYNAMGNGIKLKEVGKVVERFSPPTIERKDRERVITVSTVVQDRPMSEIIADAQPEIDKLDMPPGVTIQLSGSYESQQDSFSDLGLLAVLIIILVYIVMAAQFESFTYPGIIMSSIMFAFSGIVLILLLTGTNLNIMSMIGAIMLIGIVVKNGIVLIDYITLNRERGMSVRRSVIDGGKSRLRPVLMTSLTTILGMVPMAVGSGEGAEMWRPMGIAVIGGLTFSTILTLLFVPTMYTIFAYNGMKRTRKKLRKAHEKKAAKNNEQQEIN